MKPSERWRSLVQYYAERVQLDPDLCFRQMMQESSGNPRAVSPAGAKGLFQLMPGAAHDTGVTEPFDPDQNVRGGTEYLARQVANVRLATEGISEVTPDDLTRAALAAYNA